MKLICLNCGHEFEGSVSKDELVWHSVCSECESSFDVDLPEGHIIMAFADDSDPSRAFSREVFRENMEESIVKTFYTFDTVEEFLKAWNVMVENPDGMWYWVVVDGKCICSGACDPDDEDCFAEYFGLNLNNSEKIL